MSKKRRQRPPIRVRRGPVSPRQIEAALGKAERQLMAGDYEGVVRTTQRILRHVPAGSASYGEAQYQLGMAYISLRNHDAAYEALTRALAARPDDVYAWYNRGLVCRYTMRMGQSVRDLEQVVALGGNPVLQEKAHKELAFSRKLAQAEMALRGPDFTLDQLIEQQETFQRGLQWMRAGRLTEAETAFRRVIEMGDCLPQPWGNLAGCLLLQERYDEAEAAYRRALAIDPEYDLARQNLALMPQFRRSGPPANMAIRDPFEGREIKQSVTFIMEEDPPRQGPR